MTVPYVSRYGRAVPQHLQPRAGRRPANMLMVLVSVTNWRDGPGWWWLESDFFLPTASSRCSSIDGGCIWAAGRGVRSIQRGLAPVAIGLMTSGTYAIARLSIINVQTAGHRTRGVRDPAMAPRQSGSVVLLGGAAYVTVELGPRESGAPWLDVVARVSGFLIGRSTSKTGTGGACAPLSENPSCRSRCSLRSG